ncbi:MAG: LapA family protein [Fibrobacteria bacterium]|nr:LapA family protein [Fibrobacteria bacterium]
MGKLINALFGNIMRVIVGVILAAIIIFLWQNWPLLNKDFELKLFGSAEYALWVWLLVVFVAGNISWMTMSFKSKRQLKKELYEHKKELKSVRSELDRLRNLSLSDEVKELESGNQKTNESEAGE